MMYAILYLEINRSIKQIPLNMNKAAVDGQLDYILNKLRKASNFGVGNIAQPKKKGQNGGKVFLHPKGPLDSTDFKCVKKCFDEAFSAQMDQRFGNVDVIKSICHLVMCVDEKRAKQFALALTNSLMETHHPVKVAERLEQGIRRFQKTTEPQLTTSGVEGLIDKLNERIEKVYGKAA